MKKKKRKTPQESIAPSRIPPLALALIGLLSGSLILYFHLLNDMYHGYYYSNTLLDTIYIPGIFEFFNRVSGIGVIVMSAAYILYAFYCKREIDSFLEKRYRVTLIILLSLVCLLAFVSCYHKYFHNDEIEHIHSAWHIKQGHIPYRDFFQHHNPLFWYLILPILYIFGDSTNTLLAARIIMGIVMSGIAYFTYLISVAITESKETGLISVALLFSTVIFMEKSIEIRPDPLQILFGMLSIYLLVRFSRNKEDKFLLFSGLSASVSFLFLQKTIFLLISYAMIFAYAAIKKEIRSRSALYFLAGLVIPLLIFLLYLQLSGSFDDYLLTNWQLNMANLGSRHISLDSFKPLIFSFSQGFIIWFIISIAVIFLFLNNKTRWEIKMVTFLAALQLISLMSYSFTFTHYYLFAIPLLCITGSYYLSNLLDTYKIIATYRIALIGMLLFCAMPFLLLNICNSNRQQLKRINYFLGLTKEADMIYDGTNTINLFRNDVHYFWYQLGVIPKYNMLTNNRFGNYDICRIIRLKKPKIITDFKLDYYTCELDYLYRHTDYPNMFIRKEESNTAKP